MQIKCNRDVLKENLLLVNRAIPARPTHPVLGNVLIQTDKENQKITLTAFDLNFGIKTTFKAEVQESGDITLPAQLFNNIISRLPEGNVTLELDNDDEIVEIKALSSKFKLHGMPSDEFPELPIVNIQNGSKQTLSVSILQKGINATLFAASTDETKQILTGVYFENQNNTLEFAATDGHRLATMNIEYDPEEETIVEWYDPDEIIEESLVNNNNHIYDPDEEEAEDDLVDLDDLENDEDDDIEETPVKETKKYHFVLPRSVLNEIIKTSLFQSKEFVDIYLGTQKDKDFNIENTQILLDFGDQKIVSRGLSGAYPNYPQLIPKQFARTVVFDLNHLIASLKTVAVLLANAPVKFEVNATEETVTLKTDAKELGNAQVKINAQITGSDITIGFNQKYLLESLEVLQQKLKVSDIQFLLNEPTNPVLITTLDNHNVTHLIMPVQIRD